MRTTRTTALSAMALILAAASQVSAAPGGISDVRGDANGTDRREQGVSGADDVQTAPVSLDATDVLGAELTRGAVVIHLASNDSPVPRLVEVTLTTSRCARVTVTWESGSDNTRVRGCHRIQELWLGPARISASDLLLPLPTRWPRWLPAGTTVTRLSVQTHGEAVVGTPGVGVGALYVGGDYATGSVSTILR